MFLISNEYVGDPGISIFLGPRKTARNGAKICIPAGDILRISYREVCQILLVPIFRAVMSINFSSVTYALQIYDLKNIMYTFRGISQHISQWWAKTQKCICISHYMQNSNMHNLGIPCTLRNHDYRKVSFFKVTEDETPTPEFLKL